MENEREFRPNISARRICDIAVRLKTGFKPVEKPRVYANILIEDAINRIPIAKAQKELSKRHV